MKHKILVLSFDAMVGEDVQYLRSKPGSNFNRVMQGGASVEKMRTVYPSLTYPAHFSMASGCYPGKTGFYHNFYLPDDKKGRKGWVLESDHCPVEDFFAPAKRAGMTTASVYWPSMGNNPNIDYLINEIFPDPDTDVPGAFAAQGANEAALQAVEKAMPYFPVGYRNRKFPAPGNTYDAFLIDCLCTLIREQKPDFAVAHQCYLDSTRHRNGVFGPRVLAAADVVDAAIGKVADALEAAGVYDDTDFVIISDHGQMDFRQCVKHNIKLAQDGFLTITPEGTIGEWDAYVESNGMSAVVYLRDKDDPALCRRVYAYLQGLVAEGVWGIGEVLTAAEARARYQLYGGFSFVLETDGQSTFHDGLTGDIIIPCLQDDYSQREATHGYAPEKGPQPVFWAKGPSFREGAHLENANVVDIAPTLARIMGQTMPDADGRVLTELLK